MSEERTTDRESAGDGFDSDPGQSEVVDAGSTTVLCGVRFRCNLVVRDFGGEAFVRLQLAADGGLCVPGDAGACVQLLDPPSLASPKK